MLPVKRGEVILDVCPTCAGIWFDPGEIVLLKEEDFPAGDGGEEDEAGPGPVLLRSKGDLSCPGCRAPLVPVDYQYTGSAVYHCRKCRGSYASRKSATNIHRQLMEGRERAAPLLAKRAMEEDEDTRKGGFAGISRSDEGAHLFLPLPALFPVESEMKLAILPYVTLFVLALFVIFFAAGKVFFGGSRETAEAAALLSGKALGSPLNILGYGFFHTHLLPLVVNGAFLFIAGSPLEERLSPVKFILLFFAGLVVCGLAHMYAASPGVKILGAAGATSAILGGYVVLFPLVRVRVYAMGYLISLPSYLMAIAWLAISFFMTGDFISAYLNPYGPGFVPVGAAFLTGLIITAGLKMASIE